MTGKKKGTKVAAGGVTSSRAKRAASRNEIISAAEAARSGMATPTLSDLSLFDKSSLPAVSLTPQSVGSPVAAPSSSANDTSVARRGGGTKRKEAEVIHSDPSTDSPLKALKTETGSVYLCGSGDCEQLGMGEDVDSLPRFKIHPFFNDKDIVSVCAGGLHNLALTKNGKIYSWGCNDEKALGHSGAAYEICLVEGLDDKKIVQIACGDSISAALTDEGHVYAWGTFRDSRGVLGFDEVTEMQARPKLMEALLKFKVVHIAAGANHLVALTKNDKIYSWGSGERGQLGRRILDRHRLKGLKPQSVTQSYKRKVNSKYTKIVCGSYHTLALNQTNNVFSFGLNNFGQLGLGDHEERLNAELVPPKYFDGDLIVDIGAGEHHSIFLTSSGKVYCTGRGDSSQLGFLEEDLAAAAAASSSSGGGKNNSNEDEEDLEDEVKGRFHVTRPKLLSRISDVEMIATGTNHNLAKTRSGCLYSWGYGDMYQLGNGKEQDESTPYQVKFDLAPNIMQLQAGAQHSLLLVSQRPYSEPEKSTVASSSSSSSS